MKYNNLGYRMTSLAAVVLLAVSAYFLITHDLKNAFYDLGIAIFFQLLSIDFKITK